MNCIVCHSKTKNPKFCSRSCSAKFNNKRFPKRSKTKTCRLCHILIPSSRSFCDECFSGKNPKGVEKLSKWLNGEWRGGTDYGLSQTVRNYLLELSNYSCSKCGFCTVHPDDGHTILEINHIDGNGLNHSPNNLEVLCPNCHTLTPNYRGRNIGNGRPVYYLRKHTI